MLDYTRSYIIKDTFTVSFFGQNDIIDPPYIRSKITKILLEIIKNNKHAVFLTKNDTSFDRIARWAVKRALKIHNIGNTETVHCRIRSKSKLVRCGLYYPIYYPPFYEKPNLDLRIKKSCLDSLEENLKRAATSRRRLVQLRNRSMADRSDLIICYLDKEKGSEYDAVMYAYTNTKIINLADDTILRMPKL